MIMAVSLKWMLRSVLAVALAVLLAGCGAASSKHEASEAATDHAPDADSLAAPITAADPNDNRPVIVAFGDSISAGFGVPPGRSYPDDLQRLLDKAGYRYRVVNLGVSGDTTTDALERVPSVLAVHPAIAILEFGGNDGLRGLPVAAARKNMEAVIEQLQKARIRILLAGMTLPRNYGPEYIQTFDQMYVDLAKKYQLARIPFVLDGVGGHTDLTQPDGIHPTEQGAVIVAGTVMKYLEPMLGKG
jgi:acyl-CoA thioesterase-1